MALHTDVNMDEIQAADALVPEGTYRVRVTGCEEKTSQRSGQPIVEYTFTIQDEGPAFGRTVRAWPSLQKQALFTLKSIYKACGYNPGPEGHDPEQVLDCELYIKVVHKLQDGETRADLPPYGFKSLTAGPGR